MSGTVRLTMTQAIARYLSRQMTEIDGRKLPLFGGVWAIFGHGNVAAMGEALYQVRNELPTFRGHNEQSMAHAAVAYANKIADVRPLPRVRDSEAVSGPCGPATVLRQEPHGFVLHAGD